MLPLLLLSADASLGKVDKYSLPQQTLMELCIDKITNKEIVCGSAEDPADLSKWSDIVLNDHLEIIEINWMFLDINGSIALEWLPPTFQKLAITNNKYSYGWLTGTINLTDLPDSLLCLNLYGNHLKGTIVLTALPTKMEFLDLSDNKLTGRLDLTQLPSTLRSLDLSMNDFCGSTDFSRLPVALEDLNLEYTDLAGTIVVDPEGITCHIHDTAIILKYSW